MRNAFADEVTKLAVEDRRLALLSGDIGNRLFDDFKAKAPERFINCGIAEANMMSMAGGMALAGLKPIAYTITPFVTTRCLEQIRVDVCYHNVPVTIVGVGAGLSYASLGATHQSCEDIAFLRALPNMAVLAPADPFEVRGALRLAMAHDGPIYMRLGKKGEKKIHATTPEMRLGGSITVRDGRDVCLLSVGVMLPSCIEAAERLELSGVSTQVVSLYSVKPLDTTLLEQVFDQFAAVLTVEEHSRIGGAGGAIAEWLSDGPPRRARFGRVGTQDHFMHENGHTEYARQHHGLDVDGIVASVRLVLAKTAVSTR
jgi:transketolase